ncbi:MAG TPA: P-type conjugative transfer protein TrbG [Nitrosospira sp.]
MNMKKLVVALAMLPFSVQAQVVPAIDKTAAVEAYPMYSGPSIQLDAKERQALELAREWKNNPDKPIRGKDGSVQYVFGATLPALVCSFMRVCMIRLQEGEVIVDDIGAGDKARWEMYPVMLGPEGNQTLMVAVKPKYAGLVTNIVINTDRRSYKILLKSTEHQWMPELSFIYPDDADKAWAAYRKRQSQVAYSSTLSTGENVAALDFNYRVSGESSWKPIRVYNDGAKTYIQFATANFNNGAPALVALGKDAGLFSDESTEVVNYRVIGDRYIVDGMPKHIGLISGVGKSETKVMIDYAGGKQQ